MYALSLLLLSFPLAARERSPTRPRKDEQEEKKTASALPFREEKKRAFSFRRIDALRPMAFAL